MKIKKILVSQPEPTDGEKSPYAQLAKKHSIEIDYFKFFRVEGISTKEFRKQRINILEHTAIILTSRNAVDSFFRISKEMRIEMPETMKYFCISEAIAFYLQKYVQYRKRKIFHGKQTWADLADLIKKHKTEKFLIPSTDLAKHDIPKFMDDYGVSYTPAMIYKTVSNDLSSIKLTDYDLVVLFSPAGVNSLMKNYPNFKQGHLLLGAFGASTEKSLKNAGFTVHITAPTKTCPSMTMAIDEYIATSGKRKAAEKKNCKNLETTIPTPAPETTPPETVKDDNAQVVKSE